MPEKPEIGQENPDRKRVATDDLSGYRADTDDVLKALELAEEEINPTARAQKRNNAAGGGPVGMMPPMMGGVGSPAGAAGAAGRLGAASVGGPASVGSVAGVGPGTGIGGLGSGAGSLGGAGGVGSTGPGAGVGTVAAGSSGRDYGFGVNPATGRPWSPSDPGFTERFGGYDPATGKYVNPVTGQVYDPTTGTWTTPDPGTGGTAQGTGGAGGVGGIPGADVPGRHTPAVPGGTSPGVGAGDGIATGVGPGMSMDPGTGMSPIAGGGPGGSPSPSFGGQPGIEVDPVDIDRSRKRWDDLGERMRAVQSLIDSLEKVTFEKVSQPLTAYSGAELAAVDTAGTSTAQMASTSTNLGASAAEYNQTEQENVESGEKVVGK